MNFSCFFISNLYFRDEIFFECPPKASSTFAPTDVPSRNICLDNMYSCFVSTKYLYNFIIRKAKAYDLSLIIFSF